MCCLKPGLTTIFLARYPFEFGPGAQWFAARHAPFLSCKCKNLSHEYPKTYGGQDYLSTWSRYPYVLGHSCHEFFHLHDKNRGCRAANFRHQGQIQMGTVPKKVSCKSGLSVNYQQHRETLVFNVLWVLVICYMAQKSLSNLPAARNIVIIFAGEWRFHINYWNVIYQIKLKWVN